MTGILVHTPPAAREATCEALARLPGVEVHASAAAGRRVVTAEDVDGADPAETLLKIQNMTGVLSAALVFHRIEDGEGDAASAAAQQGD